ncbi:FAD-dependent oxidoreductase [Cellulosilyticum ruminicola]
MQPKLETLPNGAIVIDDYMETSEKDVFAAGNCCMVR